MDYFSDESAYLSDRYGDGLEGMSTDVDSVWSDDSESDFEPVKLGKLLKRLRSKNEEENKEDDGNVVGADLGTSPEISTDMWTMLPDEVMISVVARLSYSSFCSFRSVCRKWNSLMVYPDSSLMTTRESHEVPVCVIYIGSNRFASYNPSSHAWNSMPPWFGSSLGALGFQGETSRLVAAAGGILLMESNNLGLWMVNPLNKSERRLPPPLGHGDVLESIRNMHIHLEKDSYKLFVDFDVNSEYSSLEDVEEEDDASEVPGLGMQIYDSRSDTWEKSHNWGSVFAGHILSSVEYHGEFLCLVFSYMWAGADPCSIYSKRDDPFESIPRDGNEPSISKIWYPDSFPRVPKGLRGGQLFLIDGDLMLGGVTLSVRAGYGPSRTPCAHLWKLNYYEFRWNEVTRMPVELMKKLSFNGEPHVLVQGGYMWVTDYVLTEMINLDAGTHIINGVMCHIASDSWWELPRYLGGPESSCDPRWQELEELHAKFCMEYTRIEFPLTSARPFLYTPRMDLVL